MMFRHRPGGPFLFAALSAAIVACRSEADDSTATARDIVEVRVEAKGFLLGYDEETDRLVRVGVSRAEALAPRNLDPAALATIRERLFRLAFLDAKFKIMETVYAGFDASLGVKSVSEGESESTESRARLSVESRLALRGFRILDSDESWEGGKYEVAVAVGWCRQWENDSNIALRGDVAVSSEILPSPEWKKWAERQDFSRFEGARTFIDENGVPRIVGIGVADAGNGTALATRKASAQAHMHATQALAFFLFSDLSGKQVTEFLREDHSDLKSQMTEMAADRAERLISGTIRDKRIPDAEVYTTTVIHPLSGRKLFVSVVGIEPCDLAKMNLLGERGAGASRSGENPGRPEHPTRPDHSVRPEHTSRPEHPNRPDHSFRPEHPNRPDHSFRPASNRPEHPSRRPRPDEDDGDDGNDMDL